MELIVADKHLSSQFDAELNHISTRVLEMGGLVESQLQQVLYALGHHSPETCDQVLDLEDRVDAMEVQIDHDVNLTMCRRQPTARDLRLLVGVSRIIINLERAGDEVATIARVWRSVMDAGMPRNLPTSELGVTGQVAANMLHQSLDAFARMDIAAALGLLKERHFIETEHQGLARKMLTYMMEDPRTISVGLNLQFLARAIERIAAHARNLAEAAIYIFHGADLRHTTEEQRAVVLR